MFRQCRALTSLDLRDFNTGKVTNMYGMFDNCWALKTVNFSSFNTTNVRNMSSMFSMCKSLTELDLSSFDTSGVITMSNMFYFDNPGISKLKTIKVDTGWTVDQVTASEYMFQNCDSIVGIKGTVYNAAHIDKTYAIIDG